MTGSTLRGSRSSGFWLAVSALAVACALVPALVAPQQAHGEKFKVLYTFPGGTDGAIPAGKLILDASGNLYGTTEYTRADYTGYGTIFKLDPAGQHTVLYTFSGKTDGAWPYGGLLLDASGNLYGTTTEGGYPSCGGDGCGVVFKLDPSGNETVLYQFQGGSDGGDPNGDLVGDQKGNLYGTAYWAPYGGPGNVFKVDEKGNETVLHEFQGLPDGASPLAGMFRDKDGNLLSTTIAGGGGPCFGGCGTVFKLSKSGKQTIVYRFLATPDGAFPYAGLIPDAAGNFYGTTYNGGDPACNDLGPGCGTVFEVSKAGRERVLHRFHQTQKEGYPWGGLVRDASGNLYGTTAGDLLFGQATMYGSVFKLDPQGKETVLHTFTGGTDGCAPIASLTLDSAGNLYGTASGCGANGVGVVFEITP
jgi:uncharacterized repeat protein (TIGR03803 family)